MDDHARQAAATFAWCVEHGRVESKGHLHDRVAGRQFLWADVLLVLAEPASLRYGGYDDEGRDRWFVEGPGSDGQSMGLLVVIDHDHAGAITVVITMVWGHW